MTPFRAGPARASCPCSERAGTLASPGHHLMVEVQQVVPFDRASAALEACRVEALGRRKIVLGIALIIVRVALVERQGHVRHR